MKSKPNHLTLHQIEVMGTPTARLDPGLQSFNGGTKSQLSWAHFGDSGGIILLLVQYLAWR
jgi:hypothetical protein